jgi:hypothetical protein
MDMESNSNTIFSQKNSRASRFTPRELIKYHIEHPDIPITDKDIENLVIELPKASNLNKEYQVLKEENSSDHSNNNDLNRPMLL